MWMPVFSYTIINRGEDMYDNEDILLITLDDDLFVREEDDDVRISDK